MCDIGCIGCNHKKCLDPLRNWRLWMKRRQKMHQRLTQKLDCLPGELLMNSGDTYRTVKEEKLILRYTQIENNYDKYRGDPNFWRLPPCLKNHLPPFKGTEYFLTRSKEEKNEIPELEYVGVPSAIMDEKDIRPRTRHLKSLWAESKYRQFVMETVFEKLLNIEPHKPILSDLVIIGTGIGGEPESLPPKQERSSTQQEIRKEKKSKTEIEELKRADSIFTDDQYIDEPSEIANISLKINNKVFNEYSYSAHFHKENTISIVFEHFTDSLVPSKKSILFENTGNVTLRLYWTFYKDFKAFIDYNDDDINFHPFNFEKSELCLIPGEQKELLVCFHAENPGNYYEYWEITSLPNIWSTDFRLLILFQGFAVIRNYEERITELNEKLQHRIRNTAIKEVLNDIIHSGTYSTSTAKKSFNFAEQDLFESANLVQHFTPKYVYNASIIAELKQFYRDNKSLNDPEKWDLSIQKLGEIAREKDLLSYFDRKLMLFKKAKLRRAVLQQTVQDVHSKAAVVKESKRILDKPPKEGVQQSQLDDTIQSVSFHKNLNDILRKLEKPSIYINKEREKYLFSYIVMKTYFAKIFYELDKLESNNPQEVKDNDSINKDASDRVQYKYYTVPERLMYEIFDERYILRTKILSHASEAIRAKPKSMLLKGIAVTDTKKVYKMYFSEEKATQKGAKDKIQAVEAKKSVLKGQKAKTQATQGEDLSAYMKEHFDPYHETFPLSEAIDQTTRTATRTSIQPKEIDTDKYLIVYTTLCQAIDALEDTIEAFEDMSIPSNTLSELMKCDIDLRQAAFERQAAFVKQVSENTEKKSLVSYTRSVATELESPRDSIEHSEYLEFIKDLHWKNNPSIKQHFLTKQEPKIVAQPEKKLEPGTDFKSQVKQSLTNVFSLEDFKIKIEPYCLKERFTQTEGLENVDEDEVEDAAEEDSINAASEESLEKPRNIFYFLGRPGEKESEEDISD